MSAGRRHAVLLAAHGERGGTGANDRTLELARELEEELQGVAVTIGFFKAEPSLEEAVDAVVAGGVERLIVAPLLMADGYFAGVVLRRALRRAPWSLLTTLLPPIGTDPVMRGLALGRARILARERGWTRPSVLVVGHGTRACPASRRTTESAAALVRAAGDFARVGVAFLDDAPSGADAIAELPAPVVVIPYLWSAGRHALDDVGAFAAPTVAVDRPLGEHPSVAGILARSVGRAVAAHPAANARQARRSGSGPGHGPVEAPGRALSRG